MTGFQKLCLATCATVFCLIVLGGVVRATDSGLGCGDDWPRCEGSFIPRFEKELLIEYSHRLTASVAGALALGALIWAWRSYRSERGIFYPALLAFGLILFQAGLGAAAVRNELAPEIVAVHLGLALTLLTLFFIITTAAFAASAPLARPRVTRQFGQVALLAAAIALPLMLIGSYVSGAGYGLACNGWPLCNGDLVPSADAASVQVHFLHRVLAGLLGVTLVALAWLGWRGRRDAPLAAKLSLLALAVFVLQTLLGAANVWTELADEVRGAHLGVGALLWSLLAVLNIRVHRLHELWPSASRDTPDSGLARVAR